MLDLQLLGRHICTLRQARKITQKDLAEKVHISAVYMNQIEKGRTGNISLSILLDIANVLDVSIDYLLSDSNMSDIEGVKTRLKQMTDKQKDAFLKIIDVFLPD